VHLEHVTVVVADYDSAIEFFVGALGFDLVEDSPSLTNDGRPKRWVVVRPPRAATSLVRPVGGRVAGLLEQLATGRGDWLLSGFEVARWQAPADLGRRRACTNEL